MLLGQPGGRVAHPGLPASHSVSVWTYDFRVQPMTPLLSLVASRETPC